MRLTPNKDLPQSDIHNHHGCTPWLQFLAPAASRTHMLRTNPQSTTLLSFPATGARRHALQFRHNPMQRVVRPVRHIRQIIKFHHHVHRSDTPKLTNRRTFAAVGCHVRKGDARPRHSCRKCCKEEDMASRQCCAPDPSLECILRVLRGRELNNLMCESVLTPHIIFLSGTLQ